MYLDVLKKMKQNLKLMKLKEKWEGKCHNHIPLDYLTSKVDQSDSQNRRGHCWSWCSLVRAKSLSHIRLFVTPWTVAHQAPLSMGFSRQEYCSGLPCPPPGNLPDPGMGPTTLLSLAPAGRFFTTQPPFWSSWSSIQACEKVLITERPYKPVLTAPRQTRRVEWLYKQNRSEKELPCHDNRSLTSTISSTLNCTSNASSMSCSGRTGAPVVGLHPKPHRTPV